MTLFAKTAIFLLLSCHLNEIAQPHTVSSVLFAKTTNRKGTRAKFNYKTVVMQIRFDERNKTNFQNTLNFKS
jgi:hypothetical protein